MRNLRLYAVILVFVCAPTGWATAHTSYSQADVETSILLRDDAMSGTRAWNIVESLTTEVGPRLAGSEAEARARNWEQIILCSFSLKRLLYHLNYRLHFPLKKFQFRMELLALYDHYTILKF